MQFDVILVGATSFVGSRFAKYYREFFESENLKVLLTARNLSKIDPSLKSSRSYSVRKLDMGNPADVAEVVKQGRLVLNFVGPFDLYAEPVVAACAEFGVNYLDITGEVHFAKRMIQKFDDRAKKSGAVIVPFAGFDSIPSDYAVYRSSLEMEKANDSLESVDVVMKMSGGFNGGTAATALDMATKLKYKDVINREYLNDAEKRFQKDAHSVRFIPELRQWVSPFFMEPINSKVVYRSISLRENRGVSKNFEYRESIPLPGGKLSNQFFTQTMNLGNVVMGKKWGRRLARRFMPAPGQGPSESAIQNGFFKGKVVARGSGGAVLRFEMFSKGDPGNLSTIKLMGSAMKCLIDEKESYPAGIVTPSFAFKEALFPYLEGEGIRWSVV